ncbi:MAG TPA: S-layer protein [Cyanobacteria bacterium UBA11369]|nr:S-layer protein [Cyanobacteria bacterium UBA11371]HBE52995.1 S-layer protein [Cyanobacteria bacterium UBA11369]
MSNLNLSKSGTALLTAIAMTANTTVPLAILPSAVAQTEPTFSDVSSNYWAKDFISALAARNIIAGFPDGRFRPNAPVTRAQFATMVGKAFNTNPMREPINFVDVPSNYWAADAINEAYTTGFLSGYPGRVFRPNQRIPREQVLVSLASGLNYSGSLPPAEVLEYYRDRRAIPDYAREKIAAATEQGIVVNYPDTDRLKPNKIATRAEVAAFIYQALVNSGQAQDLASPYIVARNNSSPAPIPPQPTLVGTVRIPSGTRLPVKYDAAERILVAPNEPAPVPLTVTIARNVVSEGGVLLIPAGSQVIGELVTIEDQKSAQFVAKQLILTNGQPVQIRATSQIIRKIEAISRRPAISRDRRFIGSTALGVAAAAAVAVLTGGASLGGILLGAGAGAGVNLSGLFRNRDRVELISIIPNTDLTLTLNADLVLSSR